MPPPGPTFVAVAQACGDPPPEFAGKGKETVLTAHGPVLGLLYWSATYRPGFQLTVPVKNADREAVFLPGHRWGGGVTGPVPARVMVVGKWPGRDEVANGRNMLGPAGGVMSEALRELSVADTEFTSWYVTNVVKHPNLDPTADRLPAAWVKNCAPILEHEFRVVAPEFILCLGGEAATAVLGKAAAKGGVKSLQGRVFDKTVEGVDRPVKTMVCLHPAAVVRDGDQRPDFLLGLQAFVDLVATGNGPERPPLDVVRLYSERHLKTVVDEIVADPTAARIAVDCEWQGDFPTEPGAWLRTLQFTHRTDRAYVVVFRHAGGAPAFGPSAAAAVPHLRRLFLDTPERKVRLVGHNLRADLPWVRSLDLSLGDTMAEQFTVPPDDADAGQGGRFGWEKTRTEGAIDTMIAVHSCQEVPGPFGYKLEATAARYCRIPRWDIDLQAWKKRYCAERGIGDSELEGYGDCPDDVLLGDLAGETYVSYAGWDVAGCLQLAETLDAPGGPLDCDQFGNCSRLPFWTAMRASPAFLEMETYGLRFDAEKAAILTVAYQAAASRTLADLRAQIGWPEFNPNSVLQVRDLLFGPSYTGKKAADGGDKRYRPEGVATLGLTPVTTTGKPPRAWEDVVRRNEQSLFYPSTAKEVLNIFLANMPRGDAAHDAAYATLDRLRSIRFLRHLLNNVLSPEAAIPRGGEPADDGDDDPFTRGLPAWRHADGVIRTHAFPTQETGRCSTARPPLQNLCLDGETEYLTDGGWVRVGELSATTKVAQYWPGSRKIEFVQPTERHESLYTGDMVGVVSDAIDLLVTPNHRFLFRQPDGCLTEVEASSPWPAGSMLVAGFSAGTEDLTEDQADWLAAVVRWGNFKTATAWPFFELRAPAASGEAVAAAATRLDPAVRVKTGGVKWLDREDTRVRVTMSKTLAPDLYGWTAAMTVLRAELGPWVLRLSAAAMRLLIARLTRRTGDGPDGSRDLQIVDGVKGRRKALTVAWLQIMCTLSGRPSRVTQKVAPDGKNAQLRLVLDRALSRDSRPVYGHHRTREAYDGPVYCVAVPSTWIVVRRKGKVSIVGNSKKREKDYARMLGGDYRYPIRAMLSALPGHVLVDADYIGAELFMMAVQSQSAAMVDHCKRSELKDSDPAKYDIHSSIAVLAFQLRVASESVRQKAAEKLGVPLESLLAKVGDPLPGNKSWLAAAGKAELRDAAKAVVFGIPYGRGDEAVIRAVEELGIRLTIEEAGLIRAAIFTAYPELEPYLLGAQRRATDERWLANWNGRLRRFPKTDDRKTAAEMARQASNFPIQSGVADLVNRALDYLYHYPRFDAQGCRYRIALQVHDAIMFHVRTDSLEWFLGDDESPGVLQQCMAGVVVPPATLTGVPIPALAGHRLPVEYSVAVNWGVKLTHAEGVAIGVPPRYLPKPIAN
jgi:DNA polymerase